MEVRLSTDDLPFLESLVSDRADSVKAVATRLTARVPGTPAFQARLAGAAACFHRKSAVKSLMSQIGLAAAGDVTFVAPKPANPGQASVVQKAAAMAALFAGVSLDDLAAGTGFSDAQVLAALGDHDDIIDALMATAAACPDRSAHARLFDHKVAALVQASDLHAYTLMTLHALARGPMQHATAERVFASPAWAGLIARLTNTESPGRDDGALLFAAMLMPASAMLRLLAAIEPVHTAGVREARAYADLVLAIPQQS